MSNTLLLLTTLLALGSTAPDSSVYAAGGLFAPIRTWSLNNLTLSFPAVQVTIGSDGVSLNMPKLTLDAAQIDPAIPGVQLQQLSTENSQINFSPQAASVADAYTFGWYALQGYPANPSHFTFTADVSPDMKIISVREFTPVV